MSQLLLKHDHCAAGVLFFFLQYFIPSKVFPRRRAEIRLPSPNVGEEGKQDSTRSLPFLPFNLVRDTFRHFPSVRLFVRVAE